MKFSGFMTNERERIGVVAEKLEMCHTLARDFDRLVLIKYPVEIKTENNLN